MQRLRAQIREICPANCVDSRYSKRITQPRSHPYPNFTSTEHFDFKNCAIKEKVVARLLWSLSIYEKDIGAKIYGPRDILQLR